MYVYCNALSARFFAVDRAPNSYFMIMIMNATAACCQSWLPLSVTHTHAHTCCFRTLPTTAWTDSLFSGTDIGSRPFSATHTRCQFNCSEPTCPTWRYVSTCSGIWIRYGRRARSHNAMQIRRIDQCRRARAAAAAAADALVYVCRCAIGDGGRRLVLLVTGDHRRTAGNLLAERCPLGNDSACDWRRTDVLHRVTDQQ